MFLIGSVHAGSLTATPNAFTLSNGTIDVGQISVANTLISGGSGGSYFGQWSWSSSNQINNQVTHTITADTDSEGVAFNPSGTLAYVANYGATLVSVINTATNTVTSSITVVQNVQGAEGAEGVAFNPSGTLAYVTNPTTGRVKVIDVATDAVANTIGIGVTSPLGVAFNPSGTLAYVTNSNSNTVSVIDVATNTVTSTITVGSEPEGVAFNPSGTLAYVVNFGSNNVSVIDTATNTVTSSIPVGSWPISVAFNPSGTLAYVTNSNGGSVSVIDVASAAVVNTIVVGPGPDGIAFNPSGTLAYVANAGPLSNPPCGSGDTVSVIDVATNTVTSTITVGGSPIAVAFSPSSTFAYVTDCSSGAVSVISNLPETSIQNIPTSNTLQLSVNAISSNEISLTFNGITYTDTTGSNTVYGKWSLSGFAEDSNGYYEDTGYGGTPINIGNTILLSNTLTINPALAVSVSPTSNALDAGQNLNLQTTVSGGTPSFALTYSTSNPLCGSLSATSNSLAADGSNTIVFTANSVLTNSCSTTFTASVTDSASSPDVQTANSVLTVSPTISAPGTAIPSTNVLDIHQSITVTASAASGGTPPYIYALLASTDNGITYNSVASCGGTASCSYTPPTIGNYLFEVKATDNSITPENAIGAASNMVTVNPTISAANPTASPMAVDAGQPITMTDQPATGGTPPYTYSWYVSSGSCPGFTNPSGVSSFTYTPSASTTNCEPGVTVEDSVYDSISANMAGYITANSALGAPSAPTVSAAKLDADQALTVNGIIPSTGTSPYSWQWLYSVNGGSFSSANSVCSTASGTSASAGATVTCSVPASTLGSNTYAFELQVSDSAITPETSVSSASSTVTVNPTLSAPGAAIPSPSVIDVGQSVTVTASAASGGTSPYTYTLLADFNSASSYATTNALCSGTTTISCSYIPSTSGSYLFEVQATDGASTPENAIGAASSLVNVNTALSTPTISASSATYDAGQTISLTSSETGGMTPYSYQWYNDTSSLGVAILGATSATYSATTSATGTIKYYVVVTDSATTPATATSATESYTVNPALIAPGTVTSSANTIDVGQQLTVKATAASKGTSPYTYALLTSTDDGSTYSTVVSCGSTPSCSYTPPTSGSYLFEVQATDSASTPETATGGASSAVTVDSALVPPVITSPKNGNYALDLGQNIIATASTASGGTPPYTYDWSAAPGTTCHGFSDPGNVLTYDYTANAATSLCQFVVTATDSASTPTSSSSDPTSTFSLQVNPDPVLSSLTPSNATLDEGQGENYTFSISGGTGPFNVILVDNATDTMVANASRVMQGSGIYFYAYYNLFNNSQIFFPSAGYHTYNAYVTDLGTYMPFNGASISNTIYVAAQPTEKFTSTYNVSVDQGEPLTLSVMPANGIGPFTVYFNNASNDAVLYTQNDVLPGNHVNYTFPSLQPGNFFINSSSNDSSPAEPFYINTTDTSNWTSTGTSISEAAPPGYNFYICVGGSGNGPISYSWIPDSLDIQGFSSVGHTKSSTCSLDTASSDGALTLGMLGVDNTTPYTLFTNYSDGGIYENPSLSFNVISDNSYAIVAIACGYYGCANTILPSGCTIQENVTGWDTYETTQIATCGPLSTGNYMFNTLLNNSFGATAGISLAAYVFNAPITTHIVPDSPNFTASNVSISVRKFLSGALSSNVVITTLNENFTLTTGRPDFSIAPLHYTWLLNNSGSSYRSYNGICGDSSKCTLHVPAGYQINWLELNTSYIAPSDGNTVISNVSAPVKIYTEQANALSYNVSATLSGNTAITDVPAGITFTLVSNAVGTGSTAFINITNDTGLTPGALGSYTKLYSANVVSNTLIVSNITVTAKYQCGATVKPYILVNGTWTAIAPYFDNTTSCAISFTIGADPIIGIMQYIPPSTGSGGGGETSSNGAGTVGGSSGPTVMKFTNSTATGYYVYNITTDNSENLVFNGTTMKLSQNFITPNTTGITVDGKSYTLKSGETLQISNGTFVSLDSIEYVPILHTANYTVYKTKATQPAANTTTSTATTTVPTTTIAPPITVVPTPPKASAAWYTKPLYLLGMAIAILAIIAAALYIMRASVNRVKR